MGISAHVMQAFQATTAAEVKSFQSEIRRLDTRLDSLERELKLAIEIRERLAALEAKVR